MNTLEQTAPAFVEMAHRIVWCTAATVDAAGKPRSRVLHPLWHWDGKTLTGWIATGPTPLKRAHLAAHPYVSCNYWTPSHDTCVAECRASWAFDAATKRQVWDAFKNAPAPVGYDPAMIPGWDGPTSPNYAALKLEPWRLRVFPGTVLLRREGDVLTWQAAD
jgi:Pyridoxamine 5'-phosphate oxidase